jgi:hypothetical protein
MPRKTVIGIVVIAVVALVTYSLATVIGAKIVGKEEWTVWRESHVLYFFLIWIGSVLVISLPALWFAGRRLEKTVSAQEQSVAAARGVGRFAMRALQGNIAATDKLFDLLEDPSAPVRYQSARALTLLDKREVDKELFRQVRYWQASDKLALINTLKTTRDFRTRRLMELLVNDRNPVVARRAQASMFAVTPRTSRLDTVAASVKQSRTAGSAASVGLGEQSAGQRRSAGVRPKAEARPKPGARPKAGLEGEGTAGAKTRRTLKGALPSMAPSERAARAARRKEASIQKRAGKAAAAATERPPMRRKGADVAPRPAVGKPARRPAPAGPAADTRASGGPPRRPAPGAPLAASRPVRRAASTGPSAGAAAPGKPAARPVAGGRATQPATGSRAQRPGTEGRTARSPGVPKSAAKRSAPPPKQGEESPESS